MPDPIVITIGRQRDGTTYRLHPSSKARVQAQYPTVHPAPSVFVGYDTQSDFQRIHGPMWKQVAMLLTGLGAQQMRELGGVRLEDPRSGDSFEVDLDDAA